MKIEFALKEKRKNPITNLQGLLIAILCFAVSIVAVNYFFTNDKVHAVLWLIYAAISAYGVVSMTYRIVMKIPPKRSPTDIFISRRGFVLVSGEGEKSFIPWRTVEKFGVPQHLSLTVRPTLGWVYRENRKRLSSLEKYGKLYNGYHRALYGDYGIKPKLLAEMMNSYREKYS